MTICYTRYLFSILVAASMLTGCLPFAPGKAVPQVTGEATVSTATAGAPPAIGFMSVPIHAASATRPPAVAPAHTVAPTAAAQPGMVARAIITPRPTPEAPTFTPTQTGTSVPTATPVAPATTTPELAALRVSSAVNVRAGPGTAYPITAVASEGQRLPVIGQYDDWWQVTVSGQAGWIWGALVTPNAAAYRAPRVTDLPPLAPTQTPAPTATPTRQPAARADLVILGPETRYPVRARVVRGWDYELIDASTAYDFVVHRDVFGMLAHQVDAEQVTRYRRRSFFSYIPDGMFRIYLVDWVPHPDAGCAARGYGTTPLFDLGGDPLGTNANPCIDNHTLYPLGDGLGTAIGYGGNGLGVLAVAVPGPHLTSLAVTVFGELLPRPATLGPATPTNFGDALYRPLGQARWEATYWSWSEPFIEVVPADG